MQYDNHGDEVRPVETGYFVSTSGRVYTTKEKVRVKTGRGFRYFTRDFDRYHKELSPGTDRDGYSFVNINGKLRKVHRLVLRYFVGPPPTSMHHAGHRNDDVKNNRLDNLVWQSPAENNKQSRDRMRHVHGEATHTAKITEDIVRAIRQDDRTLQAIASEYDISFGQVWKIKNRKSWRHVS